MSPRFKVVLALFTIYFEISTNAMFYEEENVETTQLYVFERLSGISKSSCIHRCRRNKDCKLAANDGAECLFLKNESSIGVSNAKEMLRLTVVKEIVTKRRPKIPSGRVILFDYIIFLLYIVSKFHLH